MPDPVVAEEPEQQFVHREVKLVEARAVIGPERAFLLAQVLLQRAEQRGVRARRDFTRRFRFERAADEHGLAAIGQVDARDARAALRKDLDEALRREPPERLGYGET